MSCQRIWNENCYFRTTSTVIHLLHSILYYCMGKDKYQEVTAAFKDLLGTDHNSARVRRKVSTKKHGKNYDGKYVFGFTVVYYTVEGDEVYFRLTGTDTRGQGVFRTFHTDSYTVDEVIQYIENECGIDFDKKE